MSIGYKNGFEKDENKRANGENTVHVQKGLLSIKATHTESRGQSIPGFLYESNEDLLHHIASSAMVVLWLVMLCCNAVKILMFLTKDFTYENSFCAEG